MHGVITEIDDTDDAECMKGLDVLMEMPSRFWYSRRRFLFL